MGHSSDPGDGENHFPNDPDTKKKKKTSNKVHHLDHISSLSHYFEEEKQLNGKRKKKEIQIWICNCSRIQDWMFLERKHILMIVTAGCSLVLSNGM